ncbi:hypothetical protein M8J77_021426 [Diaphorina citri]|nr:hypothetical protein M8J77_021426 [Diaphorina citri]
MKTKTNGTQIISLEIQFGNVDLNDDFEDDSGSGVLSVRAKFLNYPTVEINENDFCDNCGSGEAKFSKGKHLLMPITEKELQTLQHDFTINIKVMRTSLSQDLIPLMEQVGYTNVNIARTFATLLSKVEPKPTKECPAVKLLSDQLEIIDAETGSIIGTMNVYIRLKAFGKCIVTAMQEFLENKSQIFDKCFNPKDVVEDDDMVHPSMNTNDISMDNNEFKELNALSSDIGLRVKVNKPASDGRTPDKGAVDRKKSIKKEKPVKPGTICMGKDQIVFKMNQSDPKNQEDAKDTSSSTMIKNEKSNPKITYGMKTGRVQPPQDQIIQMIPVPELIAKPEQGPLTGQPVDETADVYTLSISKKNAKKNVHANVEMEVRIPKTVARSKERFNRDVQYLAADVQPPAAGKGKKK